jgi:hypothetical protein
MVGVSQGSTVPTDEEDNKAAALWGSDPVHPTRAVYRMMADLLEKDIANPEARCTNQVKIQEGAKRLKLDLSLGRED